MRRKSQSRGCTRTLPSRRVGSRSQDLVVGIRHQGALLFRLRPRLLPVRVLQERRPAPFPLSQTGVAEHIDQPIAGAEHFGPVADIVYPMLLKETEGMGGEPGMKVG